MITDNDVAKIRKALKPDFDQLATKSDLDQLRKDTKSDLDQLRSDTKSDLGRLEKSIKKYIHEGVSAVVDGVDSLFQEYQFDTRIKKLEIIHPSGHHRQVD